MKRKTTIPVKPIRAAQVPVTVQLLNEMEERLGHKIDSGLHQFRAEVKSEFGSVKSDISSIKSDISSIKSELHRVALLVEEQNARNKFVLDGYAQLYELIERKLG